MLSPELGHFGSVGQSSKQPGSARQQSRGSFIQCPRDSVSPVATTSAFLNQTSKLEMFGSHFKAGLDDSAGPTNFAREDGTIKPAYVMQPISSIEDRTGSSYLQQSSSG